MPTVRADAICAPRLAMSAHNRLVDGVEEDAGPRRGWDGEVWVVSGGRVLASAIAAALRAIGWRRVHLLLGSPGSDVELSGAVGEPLGRETVRMVLVADDGGRMPGLGAVSIAAGQRRVVAVGDWRAYGALVAVVEGHGFAALDAEQPFSGLIRSIDRELALPSAPDSGAVVATALRRRVSESRRFNRLSIREQQVLCDMAEGRTAAEIAASDQVAIPTVRSHVRAILTKLEVSSQLAAVAMAYRSCREPSVVQRLQQMRQF